MAGVKLVAWAALATLVAVTAWASLDVNVLQGLRWLVSTRWGIATAFDTGFAFLWFWLWVAYKERGGVRSLLWLVLIFALGNIAMGAYVLLQLRKLRAGEGLEALLARRAGAAC